MDDHAHPDVTPVYHSRRHLLTYLTQRLRRRPPADAVPQVFALIRDDEDGDTGLIAWGMRLPSGQAVTVTDGSGTSFGTWSSPDRAAHRLRAELDWL